MNISAFIKINPADSVVVCLRPIDKGETINVDGKEITVLQNTPAGHKILIKDTPANVNIIKYGYPIGHAKEDLKQGQWVNENNLKTNLSGTLTYEYCPVNEKLDIKKDNRTFQGYVRKNGEVGVRNEIWVVPTVGCVNGIAERLANMIEKETNLEGIDAVHAWHHNFGCSQLSEDHENTRKVLRDIVLHPNAGAVLVLGLGCENNQPDQFEKLLGDYDKERIKFMVVQNVKGDEIEEGMKILRSLYKVAKEDKRTDCPLNELRIGLKCGGSDGFSGITVNPLVGELSDYIVAQGGTSILTEVPEMFGAETILMNRCENENLFEQTVKLVNDFKEYFLRNKALFNRIAVSAVVLDAVRNVEVIIHLTKVSDESRNLFVVRSALVADAHIVNNHAVTLLSCFVLSVESDNLGQIHCVGCAMDDVCAVISECSAGLMSHGVNDAEEGVGECHTCEALSVMHSVACSHVAIVGGDEVLVDHLDSVDSKRIGEVAICGGNICFDCVSHCVHTGMSG